MDKEIVMLMQDLMDDYKENGEGKEPEVWLREALIRQIPNMSEEKAREVAAELMKGIRAYRENKNIGVMEFLKRKGEKYVQKYNELVEKISNALNKFFMEDEEETK